MHADLLQMYIRLLGSAQLCLQVSPRCLFRSLPCSGARELAMGAADVAYGLTPAHHRAESVREDLCHGVTPMGLGAAACVLLTNPSPLHVAANEEKQGQCDATQRQPAHHHHEDICVGFEIAAHA